MTSEQLAEIEARAEKANDGPWEYRVFDTGFFGKVCATVRHKYADKRLAQFYATHGRKSRADLEFITKARSDVLALVEEVRRLNGDIDAVMEVLREIDTHIRSTPKPIPYIIETLKRALPEYGDEACVNPMKEWNE